MLLDRFRPWFPRASIVVIVSTSATAQLTTRVSVGPGCAHVDAGCDTLSISLDGRHVTFRSLATTLVPGDTNGQFDIFFGELGGGPVERVSVSSAGAQANGHSNGSAVSGDGRYVAFDSFASNLVFGDTNFQSDVFVRDRLAGTTERVSLTSAGAQTIQNSFEPAISADGRFVAFESGAALVPSDTNSANDVYVRDRLTGALARVSVATGGAQGLDSSHDASLSADGRFVAFASSAWNLVSSDTNGQSDVFVHDRDPDGDGVYDQGNGTTIRASVGPSGVEGNGTSYLPRISADGLHVAFLSSCTNFSPLDTNTTIDVYARDLAPGTTTLDSPGLAGAPADGNSNPPSISADGRFVAYPSYATNLVAGDANGVGDVFLRDRATGTTTKVTQSLGYSATNGDAITARIAGDAVRIAFVSSATNLVANDVDFYYDVFISDRSAPSPAVTAFCAGDGSGAPCPCGNVGMPGRGCQNSIGTGGSGLTAAGATSPDSIVLQATHLTDSTVVFVQSSASIAPVPFGDGLRCVGGALLRFARKTAVSGGATYPDCGEASVTARSAALGDPIAMGSMRHYQAWYRDPSPSFCPAPAGNTWNMSNAISIAW